MRGCRYWVLGWLACLLCSGCLRFGYATRDSEPEPPRMGLDAGGDAGSAGMLSDGGALREPAADAGGGDAGAFARGPGDAGAEPSSGMMDAGTLPPEIDDAGPPIAATDASAVVPMLDAGMDSGSSLADAGGVTADAGAVAARSCSAGAEHAGYCWFLSAVNQSCSDLCAAHGGYESSLEWVGTPSQGGALERCDALLTLLTGAGATTAGRRTDGRGLGCHLFNADRWWLYTPDFDPSARLSRSRVVCSCVDG